MPRFPRSSTSCRRSRKNKAIAQGLKTGYDEAYKKPQSDLLTTPNNNYYTIERDGNLAASSEKIEALFCFLLTPFGSDVRFLNYTVFGNRIIVQGWESDFWFCLPFESPDTLLLEMSLGRIVFCQCHFHLRAECFRTFNLSTLCQKKGQ